MNRATFLRCVLLLGSWVPTALADETNSTNSVSSAVRQALKFLSADMRTWRAEQGCAACHHGPMYVWASNVAKQQGYAVDEPYLAEMTDWLVTNDDARIFRKPAGDGPPRLSQSTIFLAHALRTVPPENPVREQGWQRVLEHWDAAKKSDTEHAAGLANYWTGPAGRPPIFNSPEIITRWIALALNDNSRTNGTEKVAGQRRDLATRAANWLATHATDDSHQGLVLRLWAAAEAAESQTRTAGLTDLVSQLKIRQRSDGGWSQSADRTSDAFATGQSLFALHRAGVRADDRHVQNGIAFLVRTQQPDGTWKMSSRPDPETGKPADFLNPITYAATAWSVLGLATQQPEDKPNRMEATVSATSHVTSIVAPPRPRRPPQCVVGE